MHILFLTHWFPTKEQPGNGVFILEHARAAAAAHKVSLIHIKGINRMLDLSWTAPTQELESGLVVYNLEYRPGILPRSGWLRQLRSTSELVDTIIGMRGRIDLIHANVASTAALAYYLGRRTKVPTILSEHTSAWPRNLYTTPVRKFYAFFLNRLDLVMPVSLDLQNYLMKNGVRNRFEILANTVDTSLFSVSKAPGQHTSLRAVIVASLDQNKGHHVLFEGLWRLRQKGIILSLTIIGDGPERRRLQDQCQRLELLQQVRFLGHLPKNEIELILQQSDFFVLSSFWENQPAALLEALCVGLPVVAPAIGGIPEIINDREGPSRGLLFHPGDAENLASCLQDIHNHIEQYDRFQIAAYACSRFGFVAIGQKLDFIYRREKQRFAERSTRAE